MFVRLSANGLKGIQRHLAEQGLGILSVCVNQQYAAVCFDGGLENAVNSGGTRPFMIRICDSNPFMIAWDRDSNCAAIR